MMKSLTIAATAAMLCLPLTVATAPAFAASAHNSQAGAMGPTSNNESATGMNKRMKRMSGKHMKHMKRM